MRKHRLMKWISIVTTGTCMLWGSGGCLPENFWSGFLGDVVISGVGSAIVSASLTAAGI